MQIEPIERFPTNSRDLLEALEGIYKESEVLSLVLLRRFDDAAALAAKVELLKEVREWMESPDDPV